MDNASNNDTFVSALQRTLRSQNIQFSGSKQRIWYISYFYFYLSNLSLNSCFPHIVNLTCKAMLMSMSGFDPEQDVIRKLQSTIQTVSFFLNIK
jgi:hypothetical protein